MVDGPTGPKAAKAREITFQKDPNSFETKSKNGGTLVTWNTGKGEPIRFWLGAAGSKDIRVEGTRYDAGNIISKLIHAYKDAPWDYGSTEAADKYQDMVEQVAKTLGQDVGSLLLIHSSR